MRGIIDRVNLLLVSLICSYIWVRNELIWIALLGIIFAAFYYYFETIKVREVLVVALCVLILVNDIFLPLFVLVIYEVGIMFWEKRRLWIMVPFAFLIFYGVTRRMGMGYVVLTAMVEQPFTGVFYLGMVGVAFYLSYVSTTYDALIYEIKRIRDDSEEFRQVTIENNKLLRQKQDNEITMATLKERNRIAREIHDNVGHLLSRSILQVGALQATHKEETLSSALKQVSATLNESMTSVRNSVHDLHNESLDLQDRAKEILDKMENYEITLEYDLSANVPMEIKYSFLSILQEAVNNIEKHSDADKISVGMMEHPGFYQLVIRDNGHAGKINDTGIGLYNMRTRVEELKGNISFSTTDGFRIFLTIPKKDLRGERV